MTQPFIAQVFSHTDGDYDLLVLTDGDVIVPARLSAGYTAHIQTDKITARDGADAEDAVERAAEAIEGTWAEAGNVHVV